MSTRPSRLRETARDRRIVRDLAAWFSKNARALPWRTNPRLAYPSLVSELMLQQTQVSRVLEKFEAFLEKFPTVEVLAAADEAEVLAAWSGLGYYRRARLLHACAKIIVRDHAGTVPDSIEKLVQLPGIGKYTAGAIVSIVFGELAPIVDGNVCRVLQRLDAKRGHASERAVIDWAWSRAGALVALSVRGEQVAQFNEGLMELGATICTPDRPRCGQCPLRSICVASNEQLSGAIPVPKPRARIRRVFHDVIVVWRRDASGKASYLLEQRPANGLWAGLWQPPAREGDKKMPDGPALAAQLGLHDLELESSAPTCSVFCTTHREVHFRTWYATQPTKKPGLRRWIRHDELHTVAISNAHRGLIARCLHR
ncbi:MAG: A/G-specific adenine glycosylase [Phycisphaeraceae bacterium]|nr:A/G-specific adenine glycosylase [Phycisphaeraceae bacterium]